MSLGRLLYKDVNGQVNDLLEYVEELEKERDELYLHFRSV